MKATVATLAIGQVLLVAVKNIKGGKLQLEFAEKIDNPNQSINVLAVLNADDDRFKGNKGARRAYVSVTPAQLEAHFGIKAASVPAEGSLEINELAPTLLGKALRMRIIESFQGSEFEMQNQAKTAKQYTGKDGEKKYFVKDGKLIFSKTEMVTTDDAKHSIIPSDSQVTWEEYSALNTVAVQDALNAE